MNEHLRAFENARGLTQASTSDLEGHRGWSRTFSKGRVSLGFFFPIEAFSGDVPALDRPEVLARSADEAGYAALWVRDVPIRDPHFGDVGQIMDPWVFASWIAAHTRRIAIGTGSVILPLRPTLDMAKASASLDCMSGGRLLFGVASGDRPSEFPLYGRDHSLRGDDFRRSVEARGRSHSHPVLRLYLAPMPRSAFFRPSDRDRVSAGGDRSKGRSRPTSDVSALVWPAAKLPLQGGGRAGLVGARQRHTAGARSLV